MCASCIREVRFAGTATVKSQIDPSGSDDAPVSAIVRQPRSLARSAAFKTFFERPLVLIAISKSPVCASPAS